MIIKKMPNLKQSLKIANLYPNIVATTIEDMKTGKWSGALIACEKHELGDTIYHLNDYTYNNPEDVICALNDVLESVENKIKIMSN